MGFKMGFSSRPPEGFYLVKVLLVWSLRGLGLLTDYTQGHSRPQNLTMVEN